MDISYWIDLLEQSSSHFVFSGLVGLLVFLLISTMCYVVFRIFHGSASLTKAQKLFTLGLGLCMALVSAWYAHILLDAVLLWWMTPQAPHLNIITH